MSPDIGYIVYTIYQCEIKSKISTPNLNSPVDYCAVTVDLCFKGRS